MNPARLLVAALALATSALYFTGLDRAPVYMGGDEAHFVAHAHALATTGRDLNGERLPLLVRISDPLIPNNSTQIWYQPVLFYLMAIDLAFLPVNEWSARLPTVAIAVVNVLLLFAIGRMVFATPAQAALPAAMLALTPAHFIMSRQALDYICPLPFVLGAVWCVLRFHRTRREGLLFAAGLILGIGCYSYIASWVLMPFFLLVALATLWPSRQVFGRPGVLCVAGFAIPLLPLAPWLWSHPEVLRDTLGRYRLVDAAVLGPGATKTAAFGLYHRVSVYWDYFNPSFLFFGGGSNPTQATARIGAFLLPLLIFIPYGIVRLWRERSTTAAIVLIGFAVAPAPVALTMPDAPEYSIARVLLLLPFGALLAAAGAIAMLKQQHAIVRVAAILLLASQPILFALFVGDYFGDYQVRSAPRFDPGAIRNVAAKVIELDRSSSAPAVFLNDDLDDKGVRWRFYLLKENRFDLWSRTSYFIADRLDPAVAAPGSLFVLYANDTRVPSLLSSAAMTTAAIVNGADDQPAAIILRRNP